MSTLWDVIAHIGIELHPDRVDYMAKKIGKISSVSELTSTTFRQGLNVNHRLLHQLKSAWENEPNITPREVAAALKTAAVTSFHSVNRHGSIELVWTGPATGMVPVRHTEQVLKEVIDSAQNRIFIVSFVAYEIPSIIESLKNAISRNVRIDILLEISDEHGGRVSYDSAKKMKELVNSVNVYVWEQNENQESKDRFLGAVHPKCVVSDGEVAFITSANLTKAAMELNMELGVLLKGGSVPTKLDQHLYALIITGIIKEYQ
jgi:cardiolipin synthase